MFRVGDKVVGRVNDPSWGKRMQLSASLFYYQPTRLGQAVMPAVLSVCVQVLLQNSAKPLSPRRVQFALSFDFRDRDWELPPRPSMGAEAMVGTLGWVQIHCFF